MPEVERIIRASLVTRALPQFAELERIRRSSVRRNARVDIHAVLLYQSGWGVHWVERPGPPWPNCWHAMAERLREAGAPPRSQWDTTHPAWV